MATSFPGSSLSRPQGRRGAWERGDERGQWLWPWRRCREPLVARALVSQRPIDKRYRRSHVTVTLARLFFFAFFPTDFHSQSTKYSLMAKNEVTGCRKLNPLYYFFFLTCVFFLFFSSWSCSCRFIVHIQKCLDNLKFHFVLHKINRNDNFFFFRKRKENSDYYVSTSFYLRYCMYTNYFSNVLSLVKITLTFWPSNIKLLLHRTLKMSVITAEEKHFTTV